VAFKGAPCERVLVVDDDVETLYVLRDLLLLEGAADVRGARSTFEAEQVLTSGFHPSAFLIDLQLDGPGGETFAVRLRSDATYSNIPIIALSGDSVALQRLGAEFDRGLLKPADLDQIIDALRELCDPSAVMADPV
jgi:CheY-like chemotaxis protein